MHVFDSAKVEIQLQPSDVERLMDEYFGTFSHSTKEQITELALTYADHTRRCALLARGWSHVLAPFDSVFGQVTDIEPSDFWWKTDDKAAATAELERRFAVATTALEHV